MELSHSIYCKQRAVRAVRFCVDGNYCLTSGSDRSVKLWNPHKAMLLSTYNGHADDVYDARGSCDNSHIVSCSKDKSVVLWDVTTKQRLRKYREHAGPVNCVQFNEESTVIVSGSLDTSIRVWDTQSKSSKPIQEMCDAGDSVTSLLVSAHEIISTCADGHVRCYDIRQGSLVADYMGVTLSSVDLTRDEACYVLSCMDGSIKLIDKHNGEMLNEYKGGHLNKQFKLEACVNNKDTQIFSGSEDGSVCCYDFLQGDVVYRLLHTDVTTVHSLSHHPTQSMLLTAGAANMWVWTAIPTSTDVQNK